MHLFLSSMNSSWKFKLFSFLSKFSIKIVCIHLCYFYGMSVLLSRRSNLLVCGVGDMIPQLAMPTSDIGHPSFNRSYKLPPTPRINVRSLGIKCQINVTLQLFI